MACAVASHVALLLGQHLRRVFPEGFGLRAGLPLGTSHGGVGAGAHIYVVCAVPPRGAPPFPPIEVKLEPGSFLVLTLGNHVRRKTSDSGQPEWRRLST